MTGTQRAGRAWNFDLEVQRIADAAQTVDEFRAGLAAFLGRPITADDLDCAGVILHRAAETLRRYEPPPA